MPHTHTAHAPAQSQTDSPRAIQSTGLVSPQKLLQRLQESPQNPRPADVLQLQRAIGNRATSKLLQAKLKLGPAGDRYEQEADSIAKQVVRASRQPKIQREGADEEEIQAKPLADSIKPIQRAFVSPPKLQRAETNDELMQAKPLADGIGAVQRGFVAPTQSKAQRAENEDELMQASLLPGPAKAGGERKGFTASPVVQRHHGDDEIQAAPNHGLEGGDVDADVARSIESARGGGQPLHDGVRSSMERGFGADFSGVRVHTGGQADALNRSLNARAFTTGKDIFFGKGQYNPGSTGGQELIAHELTHTVQQGAAQVQRAVSAPATESVIHTAMPDSIQRAIGVEFEVSSVSTWQASGLWGLNSALNNANRRKRLKKGQALKRGPGYEMQADDDPNNPNMSDLEFVTDAFPETLDGMADLDTALQAITNTFAQMANHASPMAVAGLPGQTAIPTGIVKTGGNANNFPGGFQGKPQVTVGVKLEHLATFMEDIFKSGAVEPLAQANRLQPGRQALTGQPANQNPGPIMRAIGGAPAKAHQAITSLGGIWQNTPNETPALKSLLALVIAYLDMGNGVTAANLPLVRSYAKTIAPMMARTDFAAMFNMLSDQEKAFYSQGNGITWKRLIQQVPGLNNLGAPVFAQGITIQDATQPNGYRIDQSMNGLSRSQWLEGMTKGTDYLTRYHFPTRNQRSEIEGLGGYRGKTDRVGNDEPAPIFELRAIPQNVQYTQLRPLVMSAFRYVIALNSGQDLKFGEA